jgi:hypothetical protein
MAFISEDEMSKQAKLLCTTNYQIFRRSGFNRDLKKIDALLESMLKHGFIPAYPLHCYPSVGGMVEIKGGHHRFEAALLLRIPVWYVVLNDGASIIELERATNSWTLEDYVTSFVRIGSQPHVILKEYCERSGISVGQAASMLYGEGSLSGNAIHKVKDGTFEVRDISHAEEVARIVTQLQAHGVLFSSARNLVAAISSFVWLDEFDGDTLIDKVSKNFRVFQRCSTTVQYQEMIEGIYNHAAKKKINLAFLAREHAKSRSPIGRKRSARAS